MKELNLSYLKLSHNYLHTSKMIFIQLKESENKNVVIKSHEITPEILAEETKWSDFNVLIPGLFMFYHGLELIIKGLLMLKDIKASGRHGIEILHSEFVKAFPNERLLSALIKKYAYINNQNSSELIKLLIASNPEINSTKKLYEAFRYPSSNDMLDDKYYEYHPILYKDEEILQSIDEFINDIDRIIIEAVRISRLPE